MQFFYNFAASDASLLQTAWQTIVINLELSRRYFKLARASRGPSETDCGWSEPHTGHIGLVHTPYTHKDN